MQAAKDTVRATGLPSCYVRPIAYYGFGEMGAVHAELHGGRGHRLLAVGRLPG